MPVTERRVVFAEAAERLQIQTVIVEKDFWVCWMLGRLRTQGFWEAFTLEMATTQSPKSCLVCEMNEEFFDWVGDRCTASAIVERCAECDGTDSASNRSKRK
jgi:hypothetical protein